MAERGKFFVLFFAVVLLSPGLVVAKEGPYPSRPIEVVLPFDPGGVMDISSRIIVEEMSRELKVPIVVVNLPGAGGMTGAVKVLKAKPDGYTLLSTQHGDDDLHSPAIAQSALRAFPGFSDPGQLWIIAHDLRCP